MLILDNWQSMNQELGQIRSRSDELVGKLVLGVIPSALPKVALLTKAMQKHPKVDFTILSQSSKEIIQSLHDISIEAGITYLDNEPVDGLIAVPLYKERYCLFISEQNPLASRETVDWLEAARSRSACSHQTCRTGVSSTKPLQSQRTSDSTSRDQFPS